MFSGHGRSQILRTFGARRRNRGIANQPAAIQAF